MVFFEGEHSLVQIEDLVEGEPTNEISIKLAIRLVLEPTMELKGVTTRNGFKEAWIGRIEKDPGVVPDYLTDIHSGKEASRHIQGFYRGSNEAISDLVISKFSRLKVICSELLIDYVIFYIDSKD